MPQKWRNRELVHWANSGKCIIPSWGDQEEGGREHLSVFSLTSQLEEIYSQTHSCCKGQLSPPQACLQAAVVIRGSGALGPLSCWPPRTLLMPTSCRSARQTSPAWGWDTVLPHSWRGYSWTLGYPWANTILKTNNIHFVPSVWSSCFSQTQPNNFTCMLQNSFPPGTL